MLVEKGEGGGIVVLESLVVWEMGLVVGCGVEYVFGLFQVGGWEEVLGGW